MRSVHALDGLKYRVGKDSRFATAREMIQNACVALPLDDAYRVI